MAGGAAFLWPAGAPAAPTAPAAPRAGGAGLSAAWRDAAQPRARGALGAASPGAAWTCTAASARRWGGPPPGVGAAAAAPPATLPSGLLVGLSVAGLGAARAAADGRRRRRARVPREAERPSVFGETYDAEEWKGRVKFIEGERAVFDVTIPKPLGLRPRDFPNRPGVGVAKIDEGGNADALNRRVVIDGEPGMFVLEGDEVVAVNGASVEGKGLEEVGPLVKNSPGDSVTLTLVRYYMRGPVRVVFIPSGQMATMKRKVEIASAAKVGVQEVSYSCKEGWCKACWHTDPMFGIVYRACDASSPKRPPPKNPRTIPEKWNSVVPLWLIGRRDAMQLKKEAEAREKVEA